MADSTLSLAAVARLWGCTPVSIILLLRIAFLWVCVGRNNLSCPYATLLGRSHEPECWHVWVVRRSVPIPTFSSHAAYCLQASF